jgi:hypothetical protein
VLEVLASAPNQATQVYTLATSTTSASTPSLSTKPTHYLQNS